MKLGPGLDLIETVTLHGVVDVYKMNGQRVARKWPVKAKQPRTAKQLAHWAKVRAINKFWHDAPGWWTSWMKSFNPPKGYSWYDMAMIALWTNDTIRYVGVSPDGPPYKGAWNWADAEHTQKKWGISIPADPAYDGMHYFMLTRENTSGHVEPIKWTHVGWKCYRGKKRKPLYQADISDYNIILPYRLYGTTCGYMQDCGTGEPTPIDLLLGWRTTPGAHTYFQPWGPQMRISEFSYCPQL